MTFRRPYAFVALVIWATAILVSISGCATRRLVVSGYTRAIHRYDGSTGAPLGIFVPAGSGGLYLPLSLAFVPRPVTKQIDTLLVAVEKLRLPADIEKAFKNPLQNARAAIDAGSLLPARNQLGSFTDTVRANTGNLIPVPQANRLVIAANAIRDRLRCS